MVSALVSAKDRAGFGISLSMTFVILFYNKQMLNFCEAKINIRQALQLPITVTTIIQKLNLPNMKKIILGILLIGLAHFANAQLKGILNKAKQKTSQKSNQKVDKTIDRTIDSVFSKTEQGVKEVANGDPQKEGGNASDTNGIGNNKGEANKPASLKAYSKYDFVPGEKVIGFEDFSTGSIGDFPAAWNTSGSGEIVTVEGKSGRWLWITKPGVFMPEFTNKYPEDFTFEFDLLHGIPFSGASLHFVMAEMNDITVLQGWNTSPQVFKTDFYVTDSRQKEGSVSIEIRKNSTTQSANQAYTELMSDKYNPAHVSVWRQKERVRVYVNQEKIWDIPKAIATDAKLNAIFFSVLAADPTIQYYVGNLRLAVGAPDTRKKMLEQNKWVTHGILFDVNSANIKPESYGTLKEMANVLKEYTDLKVKIVGHTDADGSDARQS